MKNLILTIDMRNIPNWAVNAKCQQMSEWFIKNKEELKINNIILIPDASETRLFWLDGEDTPSNVKELDELKGKITPILQVVINTEVADDKDPGYIKAMGELKELRDLKLQRLQRAGTPIGVPKKTKTIKHE